MVRLACETTSERSEDSQWTSCGSGPGSASNVLQYGPCNGRTRPLDPAVPGILEALVILKVMPFFFDVFGNTAGTGSLGDGGRQCGRHGAGGGCERHASIVTITRRSRSICASGRMGMVLVRRPSIAYDLTPDGTHVGESGLYRTEMK